MTRISNFYPWPKSLKFLLAMALSTLFILACTVGRLPARLFPPTSTPIPTPSGIQFETTVVYLVGEPETTLTPAEPVSTLEVAPSPTLALPPTDTPAFTPTATPKPTNTPMLPTDTPEPDPTITSTTPLTQTTVISGDVATGSIGLIDPQDGLSLPANVGGLEFKWQWSEGAGCRLPEGYGFEVRIWPAAPCCGPLGVMDAVTSQGDIGCDPETGVRRYQVVDLKGTPGVKATGVGKFLWDVVYVQLDPYTPLVASPPRMFEITLNYSGPIDPFGEDLSCGDFPSWTEAQAVFMAAGGPSQDPHGLDPDTNGIACEELR